MKYDPDDPRLTAYLLGELDEKEKTILEAELAGSEALRDELDDIRRTMLVVEQQLASEPQFALLDEQRHRIHQQLERQRKSHYGKMKWFAAGGLSAAACLLMAVVMISAWRTNRLVTQELSATETQSAGRSKETPPASAALVASEGKPPGDGKQVSVVAVGNEPAARREAPSDISAFERLQSETPAIRNPQSAIRNYKESLDARIAAGVPTEQVVTTPKRGRDRLEDHAENVATGPKNVAERQDSLAVSNPQAGLTTSNRQAAGLAAASPPPPGPGSFADAASQVEKDKAQMKEETGKLLAKKDLNRQNRLGVAGEAETRFRSAVPSQSGVVDAVGRTGVVAGGRMLQAQHSPAVPRWKMRLSNSRLRLRLGPGMEKRTWVIGVKAANVSEAEVSVMQVRISEQSLQELGEWPLAGMNAALALVEINAPADSFDGLLVYVRAPGNTLIVIEGPAAGTAAEAQLRESLLMRNGVLLNEKVEGLHSLLTMFGKK